MAISKISELSTEQKRYAVESGIPIAPTKTNTVYPFATMEVGDSFALGASHREMINVRGAVTGWNKAHAPMKFVIRLNRASGQYRCWRIA